MSTISRVVDGGYCVGCGACSVATDGAIRMAANEYGAFTADLTHADANALALGSKVCPFANEGINEDALSASRFADAPHRDKRIGFYRSLKAGRVNDTEVVRRTSSGGLTSWITIRLMELGYVDGVIHVGQADSSDDRLFSFCVSHTLDELEERRKSQYYSVEFSEVMRVIRGNGKRYVFVGVPCFVKAARLLTHEDAVLKGQLLFFVALVCGHMKSSAFAELLAWQTGVAPKELVKVDFRVKVENKPTPAYAFSAWRSGSDTPSSKTTRDLIGGNWGHATFQLKSCDYCDDIFGETADVALGDAWLPQYTQDWRGANVLVSRHAVVQSILDEGACNGTVILDDLSADDISRSQDGNFRHRWDGLSVRLADAERTGEWVPIKRIKAGSRKVGFFRKRIVRIRRQMAEISHPLFLEAKQAESLPVFTMCIAPYTKQMERAYKMLNRLSVEAVTRKIRSKLGI